MRGHVLCVLVCVLLGTARAQVVSIVTPHPVAPGALIEVDVFNNTPDVLDVDLTLLTPEGDEAAPHLYGDFVPLGVGGMTRLGVFAPTGFGIGTKFIIASFRVNNGPLLPPGPKYHQAHVVHVGAQTMAPPFITAFPGSTPDLRRHATSTFRNTEWAIANGGSTAATLNGLIDLESPNTGVISSVPLASIGLAPHEVVTRPFTTLMPNLPPDAYTVRASWTEAVTGTSGSIAHGIQHRTLVPEVDLHLVEGHGVPVGAGARTMILMHWARTGVVPYYYTVFSVIPGTTRAGLRSFPFVFNDPLVAAATSGLLSALVVKGDGPLYPAGNISGIPIYFGEDMILTHPGPAVSGLALQVCVIGIDLISFDLGCSQSETIRYL